MPETRPELYDEPLLGLGFAETQKSKLPETYKKLAEGVLKKPLVLHDTLVMEFI